MKSITHALSAVAVAVPALVLPALVLPSLAGAQTTSQMNKSSTSVIPADQPRSQMEKDQTTQNGDAPKYGQTNADPATSAPASTTHKTKKRDLARTNKTEAGDVPTYPAPAPDGTPTK